MTTAAPFPGSYPGTIGAPPDVAGLIRAAETVCVAAIESVTDDGEVTYDVRGESVLFHWQLAKVHVERNVKGMTSADVIHVRFLLPDLPPSFVLLTPGERTILFLVGRDPYTLADPVNGKLTVDEKARIAVRAEVDNPDAAVAHVARALLKEL